MTINTASVIAFLLVGFIVFKSRRYGTYLLFLYISQLWAIVSCFYIETGIFITEQNTFSFPTGATYRLVLYNIVFFAAAVITAQIFSKPYKEMEIPISARKKQASNLWLIPIYLIALAMFANSFLTFIIHSGSYNRFNFWQYAVFPQVGVLYNFYYVLIFISGYLFRMNKGNKKLRTLTILAFLLFNGSMILLGHKFSPIYMATLIFIIPMLSGSTQYLRKHKTKVIKWASVLFVIVVTLSVREYSNSGYAYEAIVNRVLGLQGHVAWGTDLIVQNGNLDLSRNFNDEVSEILHPTADHANVGMKQLMVLVSGPIGEAFIRNGANFTMGFPIIAPFMVGAWKSVLLLSILGFLFGALITAFNYFVRRNQLLPSVLLCFIFIDCLSAFTMGNFYVLFNATNLFIVYTLLTYLPVYLYSNKKLYISKSPIAPNKL